MTMNNETKTLTLRQAIQKSAIGLAIFAFFTAGIISVTQHLTKGTIADNEKAFEAKQLLSLLPKNFTAEDILSGAVLFEDVNIDGLSLLQVESSESFYRAIDANGTLQGVLLPIVAPEGYTEAIRLIAGIDTDGKLIGVRVTRHKETPGLGDQIELSKSDWVLSFNERSLTSPEPELWAVKKDGGEFDQLTGATITPRAIVGAVKNALVFFEQNRTELLGLQVSTTE